MTLFEDLKYRGLIKDISSPELEDKLNNEKLTFYIGTDPTADSMHIGHFSSFLIATRLAKYGHKPILLIGGATGLIGDTKPSKERPMITPEEVEHNVEGVTKPLDFLLRVISEVSINTSYSINDSLSVEAIFCATKEVVLSVVADTATWVSLPLIEKDKVPSVEGADSTLILVTAIDTGLIFLRRIL